jgi:hypothetical protein
MPDLTAAEPNSVPPKRCGRAVTSGQLSTAMLIWPGSESADTFGSESADTFGDGTGTDRARQSPGRSAAEARM